MDCSVIAVRTPWELGLGRGYPLGYVFHTQGDSDRLREIGTQAEGSRGAT